MPFGESARFGARSALRMAQLSAMTAAAIILAAVLGITSAAASTVVETTNGWVQGKTVGSVDQWLGIRYAASPAGVGRWTPPKPPGSYGTRQNPYAATQFGAPCPQNISQFGNSIPLPIPPNTVPVPGSADSEDCLFLNVYAPADRSADGVRAATRPLLDPWRLQPIRRGRTYDPTSPRRPRPMSSSSSRSTIAWAPSAGLAHPLLDNGAQNSSGNYGLMDQQFAMRWVNRNIRRLCAATTQGDNRRRVRRRARHLLRTSPRQTAAGLLAARSSRKSGCIISQVLQPELEVSGNIFVNALCSFPPTLACLQAAPVSAVLAAESPLGWAVAAGPEVPTLPETPQQAFSDGAFNKVPVIQGTNLDEGRLFVPLFDGVVTSGSSGSVGLPYASAVAGLFASGAPLATIESHYPISNYMTDGATAAPGEAVSAIVTDSLFACTARTADQLLSKIVPVWAYEFKDTK